jgi:hypothetical protein
VGYEAAKQASHGAAHNATMHASVVDVIPRLVDEGAGIILKSQLPKEALTFFGRPVVALTLTTQIKAGYNAPV